MSLSNTAQGAIEAYGGQDLWNEAKYIEAEVSAHGLAFSLKQRPAFKQSKILMEVARPVSKITPIGKKQSVSGVLEGQDVRLENENGDVLAKRENARSYFPGGRRLLYWDDMDMAYFANYAFWNYFTLPKLLMNNEINWEEKAAGVLVARFPKSIPTHSEVQEFHFDAETGLLKQHNYTADIISRFAGAANVVSSHCVNDKLTYPDSRIVTPRGSKGKPLKRPVLIDITVHRLEVKK